MATLLTEAQRQEIGEAALNLYAENGGSTSPADYAFLLDGITDPYSYDFSIERALEKPPIGKMWSSPGLVDTRLSLSKMGGGVFSAKIETKSQSAADVHA